MKMEKLSWLSWLGKTNHLLNHLHSALDLRSFRANRAKFIDKFLDAGDFLFLVLESLHLLVIPLILQLQILGIIPGIIYDKTAILIGNGSGHEPIAMGWVGEGLLDANIVGDIFAAPSGDLIFEGIESRSGSSTSKRAR